MGLQMNGVKNVTVPSVKGDLCRFHVVLHGEMGGDEVWIAVDLGEILLDLVESLVSDTGFDEWCVTDGRLLLGHVKELLHLSLFCQAFDGPQVDSEIRR